MRRTGTDASMIRFFERSEASNVSIGWLAEDPPASGRGVARGDALGACTLGAVLVGELVQCELLVRAELVASLCLLQGGDFLGVRSHGVTSG